MSVLYRPKAQFQGRPSDADGYKSCTAYSFAVGIDAVSKGVIVPTGHQIRALTNEPSPDPGDPGLTFAQVVAAGERFGARFVAVRKPWNIYQSVIASHRWTCLAVWYPDLGSARTQKTGSFGHAIGVMAINTAGDKALMYDPLAESARWVLLSVLWKAATTWSSMNSLGGIDYAASVDPIPYM